MNISKSLLASVLALAIPTAVTRSESVIEVEGDWVGGFDREQQSVFVRVRISRKDGELRGTCDITGESLLPEMGRQLTSVLSDDDRVRLVLPRKSGELVFEGKLTDERIEGTVIQNKTNAALHLTRITPVDATKYQGVYRVRGARDQVTYIGKGTIYPDILFFMDFWDGKFDALFPSSDTWYRRRTGARFGRVGGARWAGCEVLDCAAAKMDRARHECFFAEAGRSSSCCLSGTQEKR